MIFKVLIPGLPNDIAIQCLIRVPFNQFAKFESVCTSWKDVIRLPEFWRRRKTAGLTQPLLVTAQTPHKNTLHGRDAAQFTVCDLDRGCCSELPALPWFDGELPLFCQMVGVGMELVMIGGVDPTTWTVLKSVFVYDFVSSTWRRGADMPGEKRLFFGSAANSERKILVAGGHDNDKNALKSALMYDVVRDGWTILPNMTRERDECKCLFHLGEFHIISGYPTQSQGRFEKSREIFDIVTRQWRVEDDFLETSTTPITCVRGRFYTCREGDVVIFVEDTWQVVAVMPIEICNVSFLVAWHGKLLAIGCAMGRVGEPFCGYALNLKNNSWTKLDVGNEYFGLVGHVRVTCALEI